MSTTPGPLPRYLGEPGKQYFQHYQEGAEIGGRLNVTKFAAHVRPTDTVLDFGCGAGWVLKQLACARRIGVEVNPVSIQAARDNGIEIHPALDEVPRGVADVVISNHALEHVPAPLQALTDLRERLKEGGTLVVCVPIDDWRNQQRVDVANLDQHLYTWTPLLFGNLLGAAGFRDVRAEVLTQAWPPGWQKLAKLPRPVFDVFAFGMSVLKKRRELLAIARR